MSVDFPRPPAMISPSGASGIHNLSDPLPTAMHRPGRGFFIDVVKNESASAVCQKLSARRNGSPDSAMVRPSQDSAD